MAKRTELLDTTAVADALGLSPVTLRQHVRNRVPWLPAPMTIGGRYVWKAADIAKVQRPAPGRPEGAKDRKPRTRRAAPTAPPDASTS